MGGDNVSVNKISMINSYIKEVCSYVKFKEAHEEIKLELSTHLEDIYDECVEKGLSEEEALNNATKRMGTPLEVGKQLNLAHRGTPDWITLVLTLVLVNIGVLLMYFIKSNNLISNFDYIFSRSLRYSFIGTILIILLYLFDYRKLEKYSKYILWSVFLLIFIITFNPMSWPMVKSKMVISITPYFLIIALAGIFNTWDWNKHINLFKGSLILAVPTIMMILFNSTSSAIIYSVSFILISVKSKIRLRYSVLAITVGILAFILYFMNEPYRFMRLISFSNFNKNSLGVSYVNMQINNIINSTGLLGKGLSSQINTLPEVHTEFVFNYVLYTLGWLGAMVLITLITAFIIRVISITKVINHSYGKLLIEGLITIMIVQFVLNILMNLNLMPIIGMSLPFISYNSTFGILNMMSVGLILSVYRRRSLTPSYI